MANSEEWQLESLRGQLASVQQIGKKIVQGLRIRATLLGRIDQACQTLKQNPNDEAARRSLVHNLTRERKFIDIVRRGNDNACSILRIIERRIENIRPENNEEKEFKRGLKKLVSNVTDTLKFVSKNLYKIEERIHQGEVLESHGYAGEHFKAFMKTLKKEANLDSKISQRLAGKIPKHERALNMLRASYTSKYGRTSSAIAAGTLLASGGTLGLMLAAIGVTLALMKVFSNEEGKFGAKESKTL